MLKFYSDHWVSSGKLSDIIRLWKQGKINTSLYCLCFQYVAYGTSALNGVEAAKIKAMEELLHD